MHYQTKPAIKSVTVVSQLSAIAVIVANMAGANIGEDLAGLPEKVGAFVDAGMVLALEVVALWGRLRANARIVGFFS